MKRLLFICCLICWPFTVANSIQNYRKAVLPDVVYTPITLVYNAPVKSQLLSNNIINALKGFLDANAKDIKKVANKYHFNEDFLISMICLETRYGESELFRLYNNAGSIKFPKGAFVRYDDDLPKEPFRVYKDKYSGIEDIPLFIQGNKSERYKKFLAIADSSNVYNIIDEFKRTGYATSPTYAKNMKIIYTNLLYLKNYL